MGPTPAGSGTGVDKARGSGAVLRPRDYLARLGPGRLDALTVFGFALGLRLIFALLLAGTFDKDEFVYLALGRDVAHGAVPYRDFAFFHPPGILVCLGFLDPLTAMWWPLARVVDLLVDSLTSVLVWRAALHLFERRVAFVAGLIYALNPVSLVSAVRVDQESVVVALSMAGLVLLLIRSSWQSSLVAGVCLGAACWVKYPALVFLPVYALVARRQTGAMLLGLGAALVVLFAPCAEELHQLYGDTVTWQLVGRYRTPYDLRLTTLGIFWLLLNPFALAGLMRRHFPAWVALGYLIGGLFFFTSSVYAHYYTLTAPFAALLGAPVAAQVVQMPRPAFLAACLVLLVAWRQFVIVFGQQQGYVPASSFAAVAPIVRLIDTATAPGTAVAANQLQYPYLANRPWIAHYFWDDSNIVSARTLERPIVSKGAAVLTPAGAWFDYPAGFVAFLDNHARRRNIGQDAVWLMADPR